MGIPRIITREKSLGRSVQQVVTKVRCSPITVSVAVDDSALVSSRSIELHAQPHLSDPDTVFIQRELHRFGTAIVIVAQRDYNRCPTLESD
jgi:hypothetical protein